MKFILIDDSNQFRDRLEALIFRYPDFTIIGKANTAADGISLIKFLKPDFVFIDLQMPGGNGLSVLKEVKETNPLIKTAIVTNYAFEKIKKECFRLGTDYFFDKSNDIKKIQELLEEMTEKVEAD
jgi:DNA-binding NarL/FixJ family response regulator